MAPLALGMPGLEGVLVALYRELLSSRGQGQGQGQGQSSPQQGSGMARGGHPPPLGNPESPIQWPVQGVVRTTTQKLAILGTHLSLVPAIPCVLDQTMPCSKQHSAYSDCPHWLLGALGAVELKSFPTFPLISINWTCLPFLAYTLGQVLRQV